MRTEPKTGNLAWLAPLVRAAALVALLIAGLVFLGRRSSDVGAPVASSARQIVDSPRPDAHTPRHALPADAWLVADIHLALLREENNRLPQALEELDCRQVDPPERLALALYPAKDAAPDGLGLVVAATEASAAFVACARERMLASGGTSERWPDNVEVVSRPGGLRVITQGFSEQGSAEQGFSEQGSAEQDSRGLVLFVSAPGLGTADFLEVLQGTRPNAAEHGDHAVLLGSLERHDGFALTLALPPNWMEGLVEPVEAERSPLRFLRASAWTLHTDGLRGIVDCKATPDGDGCRALAGFLEGARDDVLNSLSDPEQTLLRKAWSLESERATRLRLRWELPSSARAALVSRFLSLWL